MSNRHLNIRKNNLHTISGTRSICWCIETRFCRWPDRSADGSVLKHSPLSQTLPQLMDNNSEYLTDTYHIMGDKAFPLTQDIVTPYKKSKRWSGTRVQKIFNN